VKDWHTRKEVGMEERQAVGRPSAPEVRRRRAEWWLAQVELVLGGAMVVIAGAVTLRHLNDRTVLLITVPGFVLGIILFALYASTSRRSRRCDESM
jgi:uncharacterized membrane protein YfcA